MATAEKKVRAAMSLDSAMQVSPEAGREFRVCPNNGGCYPWEIVDPAKVSIVRQASSPGMAPSARRAGRRVQRGVSSARLALDVPKRHQAMAT